MKKSTALPPPPKPDPTADALIQNGFTPNAGLLDINGSLQVRGMELPYPWSLPSRLFQFPIEVGRQAEDGTRVISLRHPLLAEHPFVRHVETTIGIQADCDEEPDERGMWWHAVDLISAGKWRDLLKTAQFTTPDCIAGAVAFGLRYSHHEGKRRNGYISTAEAREIMAAVDAPEPTDWRGTIRKHFSEPSLVKAEKGSESWPVNHDVKDRNAAAWGMLLGIEGGWFAHDRAGFLGWTVKGREQFAVIGAGAIGQRPLVAAMQLDLF